MNRTSVFLAVLGIAGFGLLSIAAGSPARPVTEAAAASSDGQPESADRVTLSDGRTVSAPILKETAEFLWLDMGFSVLQVPRSSVESIERAKADETGVETRSVKDLSARPSASPSAPRRNWLADSAVR